MLALVAALSSSISPGSREQALEFAASRCSRHSNHGHNRWVPQPSALCASRPCVHANTTPARSTCEQSPPELKNLHATTGEDWSRRGCWQHQAHSEDIYQISLLQAKEINNPHLPLGEGQSLTHRSLPSQRQTSSSPWAPLPLPWPCRCTARASPGAHELCWWAIKILPLSAFPQEPQPKAACCHLSVLGINYLRRAGSGTFLPSLALRDVDIRQVGPASPGQQCRGNGAGGDTIHKLSGDRQRLCCKKCRKLGKGKVSRSMSEQLCAASGHAVHPKLDWTLRAAWKP